MIVSNNAKLHFFLFSCFIFQLKTEIIAAPPLYMKLAGTQNI